jgi:hypothetical protein
LLGKVIDGKAVCFACADGSLFFVTHEFAALNIGAQNSGELTLISFTCPNSPKFKVSNSGTQQGDQADKHRRVEQQDSIQQLEGRALSGEEGLQILLNKTCKQIDAI